MQVPKHMVSDLGPSRYPEDIKNILGSLVINTHEAVLGALPGCRHRTGGIVRSSVPRREFSRGGVLDALEDGDSMFYSIIKHRLPTGQIMVLCTRCGKEWRSENPFTGEVATVGYEEASNWLTQNGPSSSCIFLPAGRSHCEQSSKN